MKSDAGPIENDRIYRSDWLSWDDIFLKPYKMIKIIKYEWEI